MDMKLKLDTSDYFITWTIAPPGRYRPAQQNVRDGTRNNLLVYVQTLVHNTHTIIQVSFISNNLHSLNNFGKHIIIIWQIT